MSLNYGVFVHLTFFSKLYFIHRKLNFSSSLRRGEDPRDTDGRAPRASAEKRREEHSSSRRREETTRDSEKRRGTEERYSSR